MFSLKIRPDYNGNISINGRSYVSSGIEVEQNSANQNAVDIKYFGRRIYFDVNYDAITFQSYIIPDPTTQEPVVAPVEISSTPTSVQDVLDNMSAISDDSLFGTTIFALGGNSNLNGGAGVGSGYAIWADGDSRLNGDVRIDGDINHTGSSLLNSTTVETFFKVNTGSIGGDFGGIINISQERLTDLSQSNGGTPYYTKIIGAPLLNNSDVIIKLPSTAIPNSGGPYAIVQDPLTGEASWADTSSFGGGVWTESGSDIYYNSGNVGVGTTSPITKLHVVGNSYVQGDMAVGPQANAGPISGYTLSVRDTTPSIYLKNQSGLVGDGRLHVNNNIFSIGADPGNVTTDAVLRFETRGSERMRIDHDGNVGIGTNSPSEKLDVDGNIRFGNGGYLITKDSAGTYGMQMRMSGTALVINKYGTYGLSSYNIYDDQGNPLASVNAGHTMRGINNAFIFGKNVQAPSNGYFGFQTYAGTPEYLAIKNSRVDSNNEGLSFHTRLAGVDSETMRIAYDGKVGIGTATPDKQLTFYEGVTNEKVGLDSRGIYFSRISDGAYTGTITANTGGNLTHSARNSHSFLANGQATLSLSENANFASSGAVTIGASGNAGTSQNLFSVQGPVGIGSSSNYYYANSTPNGLLVEGNVGIGTTSPQQKLQVEGNLRFASDGAGSNWMEFKRQSNNNWRWDTNGVGAIMTQGGNLTTWHQDFKVTRAGLTVAPTLGYATSAINVDHTWNDATRDFATIDIDVTDTASSGNSSFIDIAKGGTTGFIVDEDFNVGIGTDSPAAKLDVRGGSSTFGADQLGWVTLSGSGGGGVITGTKRLYLNSSLGYDIDAKSTGNFNFQNNSSSTYVHFDGTNERVGIGTTSPSEKLHVVGNMVLDGGSSNMFIGDSITGDGITAGQNNIGIGGAVLRSASSTTQYAVAIGSQAARFGNHNHGMSIGYSAGYNGAQSSAYVGSMAGRFAAGQRNVGIGYRAGGGNSNGVQSLYGNVSIGYEAGAVLETSATAVGYLALTNLTTGAANTAIGYQAADAVTTGYDNTIVGYNAADIMTTGYNNTAVGKDTLRSVTSGYSNTAIGMGSVSGGVANTGIGTFSLYNSVGIWNTALGMNAGYSVSTGNYGTFVGGKSGRYTTGENNTLVGYEAGAGVDATSTFTNTTAVGYQALTALTTGTGNTAIGYQAGSDQTTGSNNTLIGYQAKTIGGTGWHSSVGIGQGVIAGTNSVTIGRLAKSNQDTVSLGYSSGNNTSRRSVFIGLNAGQNELNSDRLYIENSNSTTPLIYGEFDNDILRVNGTLEVTEGVTVDETGLAAAGDYGKSSEIWYQGTGATTAGSLYYLNSSGDWANTDASAASTAKGMLAFAAGTDSDVDGMITRGFVYLGTDPGGSVGAQVFLSETANAATTTAPSTSGAIVRVIGHKVATNVIYLNPSNDYFEVE